MEAMSVKVTRVAAPIATPVATPPHPGFNRPLTPPRTRVQMVSRPTTPVKKVPTNVGRAAVDACSALEAVAAGVSSAPMPLPVYRGLVEPGKENAVPQPRLVETPLRQASVRASRGGVLIGPQDTTAGLPSKSPVRSQVLGPWVCQSLGPTVETRTQVWNANHGMTAVADVDQTLRRGPGASPTRAAAQIPKVISPPPAKSESPRPTRVVSPGPSARQVRVVSPRQASPRAASVRVVSPRQACESSPRPALRSSPLRGAQFYTSSVPVGGGLQQAEPAAAPANRRGLGANSPVRTGTAMGSNVACLVSGSSATTPPGVPGSSATTPPGAARERSPNQQSPNRQSSPVSIIASVSGWGRKQELAAAGAKAASGLAEDGSASIEQQHARRAAESQLSETTPAFRSWSWRPGQHLGAARTAADRAPQELAVARPTTPQPSPPGPRLRDLSPGSERATHDKLRSLAEAIHSLKAELSIARLSVAEQELRDTARSRRSEGPAQQPSPTEVRGRSEQPSCSPEEELRRPSPARRRQRSGSKTPTGSPEWPGHTPTGSPEWPGRTPVGSPEWPGRTLDEKLSNENLVQRVIELTERSAKEGKAAKKEPPARAPSAKQLEAETGGDVNGDTGGTADDAEGEPPGRGAVRSASAPRAPATRRRSKSPPKTSSMIADFANGLGNSEVDLSTNSKKLFWRDIIARCASDIDTTLHRAHGEFTPPSLWQERRPSAVSRRRSLPAVGVDDRLAEVQALDLKPSECQRLRRKGSTSPSPKGSREVTPTKSPKMGQRAMRPDASPRSRKDVSPHWRRSGSESPPENWREMGLFVDDEGQRTPKAVSARQTLPSRTHWGIEKIERQVERLSSSPSGRAAREAMEEVPFGSPMESYAARNTPVPRQQGGPPQFTQSSKSESWQLLNSRYQTPQSDIDRTFKKGPGQCSPKTGHRGSRGEKVRSRSPERRRLDPGTHVHFNAKESRVSWREEADQVMMAAIGRNDIREILPPYTPPLPEPRENHYQKFTSGYHDPPSRQTSGSKSGPERLFSSASTSSFGVSVTPPTEEASSSASTFATPSMQSRGASLQGSLSVPNGAPSRVPPRERGLTADSSLRISKKLAAFLSDNTVYSKRLSKK